MLLTTIAEPSLQPPKYWLLSDEHLVLGQVTRLKQVLSPRRKMSEFQLQIHLNVFSQNPKHLSREKFEDKMSDKCMGKWMPVVTSSANKKLF